MAKIDKLTQEQEALMAVVRDEWIARCDSGAEVNKGGAERGIRWLYSLCKLQPPLIIGVSSPLAAQYACATLRAKGVNFNQVWAQVWAQVRDQVWAQVRDQVWAQVGAQVWDQVGDQVAAQVWAQVRAQVGDQVGGTYEPFSAYGNVSDYNWCAWGDYFQRIGVKLTPLFDSFASLLRANVYDMIQLDGACIYCELPSAICRGDGGRLHCASGPAIKWRDGYQQHYLWGVFLLPELHGKICSKAITPKELLSIDNIEQRMVALKHCGIEHVLSSGVMIKKSERGNELWLLKDVFDAPAYYLRYSCPSTGRVYVSGIDPEVGIDGDPDKCMAWKLGIDTSEYGELRIES